MKQNKLRKCQRGPNRSILVKFYIKNQINYTQGFQNRIKPGGRIVKTGNLFFKPKEPDFLLIS